MVSSPAVTREGAIESDVNSAYLFAPVGCELVWVCKEEAIGASSEQPHQEMLISRENARVQLYSDEEMLGGQNPYASGHCAAASDAASAAKSRVTSGRARGAMLFEGCHDQ